MKNVKIQVKIVIKTFVLKKSHKKKKIEKIGKKQPNGKNECAKMFRAVAWYIP